jgi:hypothetical protein
MVSRAPTRGVIESNIIKKQKKSRDISNLTIGLHISIIRRFISPFYKMNKFCQRVITLWVLVTAVFSVLSYNRINAIVKMDYSEGFGNRHVLNHIDMNVISILDTVRTLRLEAD